MIGYRCPCGRGNYFSADEKIDGPDGEVVVFIVDGNVACTDCGMTVREMVADQEGEGT